MTGENHPLVVGADHDVAEPLVAVSTG